MHGLRHLDTDEFERANLPEGAAGKPIEGANQRASFGPSVRRSRFIPLFEKSVQPIRNKVRSLSVLENPFLNS